MSSPWAKVAQPQPTNLQDIMSEEVARDLQAKEDRRHPPDFEIVEKNLAEVLQQEDNIPDDVLKAISNDSLESDEMIAKMLQMQFNKEYDEMLQRQEDKYNGSSKVSISYENFKRVPHDFDFESDEEPEEITDIVDRKDWDRFDTVQRQLNSIPRQGYKVNSDGTMVTKHDVNMSGRKNAGKLMHFPPEFQTGDSEDFDMKISNKVFNSLKMHSKHEQQRRHRMNDKKEDQATAEFGIDQYTRLLLYKLINRQLLEQVNGTISIGKEAVIIHADTDPAFDEFPLPPECAIKVFKTTLSEFKQRDQYIKDDHRFKERIGNQKARKTVHLWAEKEMANLSRLDKIGIPCPKVVLLKKHVLLMSFIGEKHNAAPKLKDARLSDAEYIEAYRDVTRAMKKMYKEANLIHADLSEYNVLWYKKRCWFIDVSQSVEPNVADAFQFLMRDCTNVSTFFEKKGVPDVKTAEELFRDIVGCEYTDKVTLGSLQEGFKMKSHLVDKPGVLSSYNFDTAWEMARKGELPRDNQDSSEEEEEEEEEKIDDQKTDG